MLDFKIKEHILEFKQPAKTSRNTFNDRRIYLVELRNPITGHTGIGEAAPLKLLSIDDLPEYPEKLRYFAQQLAEGAQLNDLDLSKFPSIRFGLESALLSLNTQNNRYFDTPFTNGKASIPINGLVWMNDVETMLQEAYAKIQRGFKCIKFKIGAQDFDQECRMLEQLRKDYSAFKLEIRVDANGALLPAEVKEQLADLKRFDIHSIEQPVATGQWDLMADLANECIIPIALDEELIGLEPSKEGKKLMEHIMPQYLIIKPNLLGGLLQSNKWIELAHKYECEWWATSALESNIGLSMITQWVSTYNPSIPQGLGTGELYTNNFEVPWAMEGCWFHWND